jgi:hypothetical protein
VSLNVNKFLPRGGGGDYIATPAHIKRKQAVVNINNTQAKAYENQCFKFAMRASLKYDVLTKKYAKPKRNQWTVYKEWLEDELNCLVFPEYNKLRN